MDRLVRARVLLAEAEALGVTIDDLVTASAGKSARPATSVPTLAEYVETVAPSFGDGTAATYRSYWRLAPVPVQHRTTLATSGTTTAERAIAPTDTPANPGPARRAGPWRGPYR